MTTPIPHSRLNLAVRRCDVRDEQALADWCDVVLAGDYFFRRGHIGNLLANTETTAVYAVLLDSEFVGMVVIYRETTLQNLYLAAHARGLGIGAALVQHFAPETVRAKTNMLAGDPTGFYQAQGYRVANADENRPHISVMTRQAAPPAPPPGFTSSAAAPPVPPHLKELCTQLPAKQAAAVLRQWQRTEARKLRDKAKREELKRVLEAGRAALAAGPGSAPSADGALAAGRGLVSAAGGAVAAGPGVTPAAHVAENKWSEFCQVQSEGVGAD